MPKATVNGVQLYYEEHGQGFPVLLMEGFAGTTAMWRPQVPALSQRYRLILFDYRGQGQSESPPSPEDYSLEIAIEDIHGLLRHLGVEQAVVGGLSLGGYLAIHFYRLHPEMVRALILIDTGPGYRSEERRRQWERECIERAELLEQGGMYAFAHSAFATDDYYTSHAEMLKLDPRGLANVARRVMSTAWGLEVLTQIQVPALVMCGEHDRPFLGATEYMASRIPNARKVILPGACHACNIDAPEEFNRAILDFLREIGL
ncbi:AB hydrolase superfamily protein YdjP [bacterium HR25]|nr:AB hydrolase superfamily protein YdjP [bacterium HR25]